MEQQLNLKYNKLVQDIFEEVYSLGFVPDEMIEGPEGKIQIDFADYRNKSFIEIISQGSESNRAGIAKNISRIYNLTFSKYKEIKLFVVFTRIITNSERLFYLNFLGNHAKRFVQIFDLKDVIELGKKNKIKPADGEVLYDLLEGKKVEEQLTEKKVYTLPKFPLSELDLRWLEIIFEKFNNNEEFEVHHLLANHKEFPVDYNPNNINRELIYSGKEITILGIYQIDPNNKLVGIVDQIIRVIKDKIESIGKLDSINTSEILPYFKDVSYSDINAAMNLVCRYNEFYTSRGRSERDGWITITVNSPDVYRAFRSYTGLEKFFETRIHKNNEFSKEDKIDLESQSGEGLNIIDESKKLVIPNIRREILITNGVEIEAGLNVELVALQTWDVIKRINGEKGLFGVFGKWGRGKSFLIKRIIGLSNLEKERKYKNIEFDAWKFQDTPAVWAYLYETLAKKFQDESTYCKFFGIKIINKNVFRLNKFKNGVKELWYAGLSFVFLLISFFLPTEVKLAFIIGFLSIFGFSSFVFLYRLSKFSVKAKDLFKKYGKLRDYKHLLGIQAEIEKEITDLIQVWISNPERERLILVIENLDRCDEQRLIGLIDSLRIILETEEVAKRVLIISAVDERMLLSSIRRKLKKDIKTWNEEYESQYLDKIFISGIRLNSLSPEDNGEIILKIAEKDHKIRDIKSELFNRISTTEKNNIEIKSNSNFISSEQIEQIEIEGENANQVGLELDLSQGNKDASHEENSLLEVEILYNISKRFTELTPRKIRIIYYRYYLAKNLFCLMYSDPENNIWRSKLYLEAFIYKLFECSLFREKLDEIDRKRVTSFAWDDKPSIEFGEEKISVSNEDYVRMLDVLQMVIIY